MAAMYAEYAIMAVAGVSLSVGILTSNPSAAKFAWGKSRGCHLLGICF